MKKPLLLVGLAVLVSASGCKLLKKKGADGDNVEPAGAETPAQNEPKTKKPSAGCALPEGPITSEVTLKRGCSITAKEGIAIESGGSLKIEPGVKIAFGPGSILRVTEGKLVIAGLDKEPVYLTSANRTRAPGDWGGVYIEDNVSAGTEIANAVIEYAGGDGHGAQGAITILSQRSGKRVSITGNIIQNNDRCGVWSDGDKSTFAKFERNTFKANKISLSARAAVLASVGVGNVFVDPIETTGNVSETATWVAFGVPVLVRENMSIHTEGGAAPTLTLAPATVLKFVGGTYLSVGEGNGGGLVAPKVTFTSANATPHPGDWAGIFLYKRSTNVNLEGATIDYAGGDFHGGRGALTFWDSNAKEARGVKLTGLQVKNAEHAGIASPDHDCGELAKQVTVSGAPVCRKE